MSKPLTILGLSFFYHDAAACLLQDGRIIASVQEERFSRKKHDEGFPKAAIEYCLKEAGVTIEDVDYVGFYDKPWTKFERILYTYLATFPRSYRSFLKVIPIWMKKKLWVSHLIRKELHYRGRILFSEHHLSHASSAFFVSPFEKAAILTVDGVGEWATASFAVGEGNQIRLLKEIKFPHSLGMLYSAFTYYLGFEVNDAEYKVMGLAPYGRPVYADRIKKELFRMQPDGSFKVNMKYFAYDYGWTMTNGKFDKLFGVPRRIPEGPLEQVHKDLAASVQQVTSECMVRMAQHLVEETQCRNLCLAGGVALNCVANGEILRNTSVQELFIQPAASDAGGSLGVACHIYYQLLGKPRKFRQTHAFYGPGYSQEEIEKFLTEQGASYDVLSERELVRTTSRLIADQHVVGWFQGRMEFGPRALGARSILADARNPENRDRVNQKIKFREGFRPFAPSVLEERVSEYFELDRPSPYMLLVAQVRPEKREIPAVTHVDGSARIQTVRRVENPLYYDLIKAFESDTGCPVAFESDTGCPVILNTSFNIRGEPIVCTPHDAYQCFLRTRMDDLVIGNCLLSKDQS